jgi:hypothetical protein
MRDNRQTLNQNGLDVRSLERGRTGEPDEARTMDGWCFSGNLQAERAHARRARKG